MPVVHHTRQLEHLREELLRLGSMVEHSIVNALKSLEYWDTVAAAQVIEYDRQIDLAHQAAEELILQLITAQMPQSSNSRVLVTAFAIAGELERIGDYACRIARRVKRITRQPAMVPIPPALHEMTLHSQKMLHKSLDSFVWQDVDLAYSLKDDELLVDRLEDRLHAELIDQAQAEPQRIEAIIGMLDIVHALERVADRATNIGERVIYLVTSITEELNP